MINELTLFKSLEASEERVLDEDSIAVFRLDGSNFSSFTKQFEKPFSQVFERGMDAAARGVIENVFPNHLLTYVGSDEISVVTSQRAVKLLYGARVSKLLSLSAAHATAGFAGEVAFEKGVPAFDSRVVRFKEPELIREYVTWRRLDMRKNAISMAVSHLHSHRSLLGVSTPERAALLVGTPYEVIPEGTFNGRFILPEGATPATRELAEELCAAAAAAHSLVRD